jgi:S1-C subfamily serine protease
VNVGSDPVGAQEMQRKSGQRGVPVIVVDDQVVVGFDQARLEALLTKVPPHVVLGASVADAAKFAPSSLGAYVGQIRTGSAAERAGLRIGDIIVQLGGHPLRSASDLEQRMAGLAPGARLTLEWLRGDERMHGEAVL